MYKLYFSKKNNFFKFSAIILIAVFVFLSNGLFYALATWTEQTNSGSRNWTSIASSTDGVKLVATVNSGYIYTSTDSGVNWTEQTASGSRTWASVASSSDGVKLVAVTSSSEVFTSTDSGVTWVDRSFASTTGQWESVASSTDGVKLVAVELGYIYTSTDSGVNWTEQTNSDFRVWTSVASSSDGVKLAAVAQSDHVFTSTDSGVNWTEQTNSGSRNWTSIASSTDGVKLVATVNSGYIYTSTDSGVNWTEQTASGSRIWASVASSSDGVDLIAFASGHAYVSNDSGVNWTGTNLMVQGSSVASSSDGTKLAVASSTYIHTFEADVTAPTILVLSPADGASSFAISDNLVITFDEDVDVETGNVYVYQSGGALIESIDITGGLVTGTGTDTITINPTADLSNGTEYYIQIDATAIDDTSSNSFAGITDTTTWNFTTVSAPSGGGGGGGSPHYICDDELDNDGDGLVDYPEDPGCDDAKDKDEYNEITPVVTYACSDEIDNDNDGLIDMNDPGCENPEDQDEFNQVTPPPPPPETCATNPTLCPPPQDPCISNPSLCAPPPPIDPCITNPSSCLPPPPIDPCLTDPSLCAPVETCATNPTLCPPPPPPQDPCITNPSLCIPPPPPINSCALNPGSCNTEVYTVGECEGILGAISCIVSDSFETTRDIFSQAFSSIREIIFSPEGNIIIKTIGVTGLAFGAIFTVLPILFANSLSFSELALIPIRLWSLLMTLFGIKKKTRKWGVVYDSVTKQPLDPVYVTLQDVEGKEIMSSITDIDGRYGFLVEPGKYRLLPKKTNYSFPSLKVVGKTRDEIYLDLYFGYVFEVSHSGEVISKNIPMDPIGFDWNEFAKKEKELTRFYSKRDIILNKISDILFSIGISIAFVAFIVAPIAYNIAIFILYLILLIIREAGIRQKKSSKVIRKGTDIPLAFAIVRVFDTATNVEIIHKITNKIGKFFALVRNGFYYITIESKNEDGTYTKVYTSDGFEVKDGIIDKKFEV